MNIPKTALPRVVIAGAGFGGLQLAKALSKAHYQVVLIDRNNYHTFQPLLYQVASAGLEPDSIAQGIRSMLKAHENFFFRVATLDSVDTDKQLLSSDIGSISYDYLVMATGSVHNFFGDKNIESSSMPMKSIPEALDMRSLILQNFESALLTDKAGRRAQLLTYVVVGGGPTGVELTGALAELRNHIMRRDYPRLNSDAMKIYLIQGAPRLLEGMSAYASRKARAYLEKRGVAIWFNSFLKSYDGQTATIGDRSIQSGNLIWAAGVKGNVIRGFPDDALLHSRLLVNAFNQVKGFENVFAIGDVAVMHSDKTPSGHPMMAQPAIQQAKSLARNLNEKHRRGTMRAFVYKDKGSMSTLGRNHAVADIKVMGATLRFSGFIGWFMWLSLHLIWLVGFRNKVVALSNWIVQYFQYGHSVRLIIRPFKRQAKKAAASRVEPRQGSA